jgi:hypothetical protein
VSAPVDCDPLVALGPDHAPEAVHEVALLADQFKVEPVPIFTVLGLVLRLTRGADAAATTVTDCAVLPPEPLQVNA